ncbi:hypothetical protein NLU66_13490 [Brachybacterium sp. NBEC-018]|uniref:hypothetical protein n=1 Tax=Brachybacterium sp. NBEC-018 TaxID=2996004 RepID=UPI00217568C0|nr:hypothetical protein [Brachybacterium sp. NBEC-018]UVY83218.1 hypothetical protein NLU66_13490 [Brachybacterium sp. NBEC-018]
MSSNSYPYPVAVARFTEGEDSREPQNLRAIRWLLQQSGGSVVVVTPRAGIPSESLARLVAKPGVTHVSWRGSTMGSLGGHRAIVAWPDRQHLNDLWGVEADALVVIEWGEPETKEWIEAANPVQLYADRVVEPAEPVGANDAGEPLPAGVEDVLQYLAMTAAEFGTDMEWHEEQKLKADMMHRPDRWRVVTVEQVRDRARALGLSPNDVDTICGYLQRRKDGRWFQVGRSYRGFAFN